MTSKTKAELSSNLEEALELLKRSPERVQRLVLEEGKSQALRARDTIGAGLGLVGHAPKEPARTV